MASVHDNLGVTVLTNSTPVYEQDYPSFEFVMFSIIIPIVFGIITTLGILGNSLVIYVIFTRQKMQTVTNILLLNLAFSDLSFVLVCPPFTAYQLATDTWPFLGLFGTILCKLMHYLLNVTVFVTIYTLVLIASVRYMTVVHNHETTKIRTRQNTILMIVGIWILMLLGNLPVIMYHDITEFEGKPACDNVSVRFGQIWFTIFFALAYLIPLFVIAVFSLCILRHIQQQRPSMLEAQKNQKSIVRKKKASRLLIMVIAIFAILWLPVHVHLLCAYWFGAPDSVFYKGFSVVFNCMAYFNSCVNPFIYNYASKEFRESFREVVCCIHGRKYADRELSVCVRTEITETNGQTGITQALVSLKTLTEEVDEDISNDATSPEAV